MDTLETVTASELEAGDRLPAYHLEEGNFVLRIDSLVKKDASIHLNVTNEKDRSAGELNLAPQGEVLRYKR
jgi:hypothetical protein